MAFHLFMSNSLEKLAELFREKLYPPAGDVFTPVHAVVPNNGMAFFLKRTLAGKDHLGIAANIRCSFLQEFISAQIRNFLPEDEAKKYTESVGRWSPAVLSWRIDALFAREPEKFPFWQKYWKPKEGGPDPERRHLLSRELAKVFDRYQFYRRKDLAEWREGRKPAFPAEAAQAELFRILCAETPDPDTFHAEFLEGECAHPERLPRQIGVFGIGAMPEFHLRCLLELAKHTDVYFFIPSPCREYWGDFRSSRELARQKDVQKTDMEEIASHNRILSDLGMAGRRFLELLVADCFSEEPAAYAEPGEDTVLHLFQTDILDGKSRPEKFSPAPEDRSVRINNAPTARRELEILHDQLAELFQKRKGSDRPLRPEDVIVMFPDINKAAPLIESVFSNGPFKDKFAICDRSTVGQSSLIECFEQLLDLPGSRFTSREVMDFLDFPCIGRKLGIDSAALPELNETVARARICWGLDAQEHRDFRSSDFEEFSWQDGIDRLLTEFARGERADDPLHERGTEGIDGGAAENFGALAGFVADLKEWKAELPLARRARQWREFLCTWADRFLDGSDQESRAELLELRRAAAAVADSAEKAGFEGEITPEVFIRCFKDEVTATGGRQHFLRDKITFCSLVPLRAVPARVIAVLSLNDRDFPGTDRHQEFDLLASAEEGDPSRADDGRYLLLEALMAAQDNLILSYVGMKDGKQMEPAVPLGVCQKVLEEGFGIKTEKIPLASVETEPFRRKRDPEPERVPSPPPEPPEIPPGMNLKVFCRHLAKCCDAFFEAHYGFPLQPWESAVPEEDDPQTLGNPDAARLKSMLWEMRRKKVAPGEQGRRLKAARLLPVCGGEELLEEAEKIMAPLEEDDGETPRALRQGTPRLFRFPGKFELCGKISVLEEQGKIVHSAVHFSKESPEKKLAFCVARLLIAAEAEGKTVSGCQLFCSWDQKNHCPETAVYEPVTPSREEARKKLAALEDIVLRNYREPRPLPLFLNASCAFAKEREGEDATEKATEEATKVFRERDCESFGKPTAVRRFYDETVLETEEFRNLARQVFGDLLILETP